MEQKQEKVSRTEQKKEPVWKGWKMPTMKKDNFIILILAGVLLFLIAIPMDKQKDSVDNEKNILGETVNQLGTSETSEETGEIEQQWTRDELNSYSDYLEEKLEEKLSCMEGVGKVEVMVSLATSAEYVVEKDIPVTKNNTEEEDAAGGSRSVAEFTSEETTIFTTDAAGNQIPYVSKSILPQIQGVVVIAQGAGQENLNNQITVVIESLFGIEPHKIAVVKMKS